MQTKSSLECFEASFGFCIEKLVWHILLAELQLSYVDQVHPGMLSSFACFFLHNVPAFFACRAWMVDFHVVVPQCFFHK